MEPLSHRIVHLGGSSTRCAADSRSARLPGPLVCEVSPGPGPDWPNSQFVITYTSARSARRSTVLPIIRRHFSRYHHDAHKVAIVNHAAQQKPADSAVSLTVYAVPNVSGRGGRAAAGQPGRCRASHHPPVPSARQHRQHRPLAPAHAPGHALRQHRQPGQTAAPASRVRSGSADLTGSADSARRRRRRMALPDGTLGPGCLAGRQGSVSSNRLRAIEPAPTDS